MLVGEVLAPESRRFAVGRGVDHALSGHIARRREIAQNRHLVFLAHHLHALADRNRREGMHETAAAARRDIARIGSQHHDIALFGQRQESPVVLEQHHAPARHVERRSVREGIAFGNSGVELLAVQKSERDERLEDMLTFQVDRTFRHHARFDERTQVAGVHKPGARHLQIESPVGGALGRIGGVPVGHEDSFEAPHPAQNIDRKLLVLGRMLAVDKVVTRHHGAHAGLLDRLAEGREINFVERALVDIGTHLMTVPLLIVARKVFDRRHNPFGLHTLDILHGGLRRQIGVLAEVLEVTAAQGRTVDIDAGSQHDMHAAGAGVLPQTASHIAHQRPVPSRRGSHAAGEHRTAGIVAYALRTVGHPDFGNAQTRNGPDIEFVVTADIIDFFIEGHLSDQFGGALFGLRRDRLCSGGRHECERQHGNKSFFHRVEVLMVYAKKIKIFRKASDRKQKLPNRNLRPAAPLTIITRPHHRKPRTGAIFFIIGERANTYMKRN